MTELLIGAHGPNRGFREEDYRRLELMRARVVGTLWTDGTRHRRAEYEQLEQRLHGPVYVVRVGPSGRIGAGQWTIQRSDALNEVPDAARREGRVKIRALNEVNLPAEGGWAPEEYADFLGEVYDGHPDAEPQVCAPLSFGAAGWRDWLTRFVKACDGSIPADELAVNCYAHLVGEAVALTGFGKPVNVTEINTLAIPPGKARAAWTVDRARELAAAGPFVTLQAFLVGGASHGAWDERYILNDEECAEIGRLAGGVIQVAKPPELTPKPPEPTPGVIPNQEQKMSDIAPNVPTKVALSPNHDGPRAVTMGAFIHSTRSGQNWPLQREADSTVGWFLNPASQVSAHFVVGPAGVTRCVHDDDAAWHARENNRSWLGVEIAQPTDLTPYTDFQYAATAEIVRLWAAKYGFPLVRVHSQKHPGVIGHEDSEQGQKDGKTDPGHKFDWPRFLRLLGQSADDGKVRAALDAIWKQTTDLAGQGHTPEAVVIQKHVGAAKAELGIK